MGRRDRERLQRILNGDEKPIRHVGLAGVAVQVLQRQSTDKQVDFLHGAIAAGGLTHNKLRQQLETNAPKEMQKGIDKLVKRGKTPTVDLLLEEYRREKAFQKLAGSVGLDETWFVRLAKAELDLRGYK